MQSTKRLKKIAINDSLTAKMSRANAIIATDYRGMNTAQLNELRQKLADVSAEFEVAKNTLVKRALHNNNIPVNAEMLNGPTALLYSYADEVAPIKVLMQLARVSKLPVVKGGYLGKQVMSANQVETLAKLPAKEVLLAQVVGTMNAPVQNFVGVLQANITSLLYALNAIKEKQA